MLICDAGGAGEPPLREMCGLFARVDMDPVDLAFSYPRARARMDGCRGFREPWFCIGLWCVLEVVSSVLLM